MIYILKFSRKLGNLDNPKAQAQYYVGWCEDDRLEERLDEHTSGRGAKITRAAIEQGITFEVVAVIPGDRWVERAIKNRGNTPKLVEQLARNGWQAPDSLYTAAQRVKAATIAKWDAINAAARAAA